MYLCAQLKRAQFTLDNNDYTFAGWGFGFDNKDLVFVHRWVFPDLWDILPHAQLSAQHYL